MEGRRQDSIRQCSRTLQNLLVPGHTEVSPTEEERMVYRLKVVWVLPWWSQWVRGMEAGR